MEVYRTYRMGSRVICERCALRGPRAVLQERPVLGSVAIRCAERGTLFQPTCGTTSSCCVGQPRGPC
jgi:hypothetical protein